MSKLYGNPDGYVYSDDPESVTNTNVTLAAVAFFEALGNYTKLSNHVSAGAEGAGLIGLPYPEMSGLAWALFDPFTNEAEIRRVAISNSAISWDGPLAYAHATLDPVLLMPDPVTKASWFGLSVDNGGAANTTALQRAFNQVEQANANGTILDIGPGTFDLANRANPPVGTSYHVRGAGRGATILQVPTPATVGVFRFEDVSNLILEDMYIREALGGTDRGGSGHPGVGIIAGATGIGGKVILRNVRIRGFGTPLSILGTADDYIEHLTLQDVEAEAGASFGINVQYVRQLVASRVHSHHHHLDGMKLLEQCLDVELLNCRMLSNGQPNAAAEVSNGNGIDGYYGGVRTRVIGGTYNSNLGAGLYFKTGPETTANPTLPVNNYTEVVGATAMDNTSGITVSRSEDVDETDPLLQGVHVLGGFYSENEEAAIEMRGLNHVVTSPRCVDNGYGVYLHNCANTAVTSPILNRNGIGVYMSGPLRGIRLVTPIIDNKLNERMNTIDDYGAAVANGTPIHINSDDADDIYIIRPVMKNFTGVARGVNIESTTGHIVVDYGSVAAANPRSSTLQGSVGSTAIFNGYSYRKVSGAPNEAGRWIIHGRIDEGATADRPTLANTAYDRGYSYYDTTVGKVIIWTGTTWVTTDGAAP